MRAVVISITMASGQRCSVTYDRYGMNAHLFEDALANGWDDNRMISQAISNALAGALDKFGGQVANYLVTKVP